AAVFPRRVPPGPAAAGGRPGHCRARPPPAGPGRGPGPGPRRLPGAGHRAPAVRQRHPGDPAAGGGTRHFHPQGDRPQTRQLRGPRQPRGLPGRAGGVPGGGGLPHRHQHPVQGPGVMSDRRSPSPSTPADGAITPIAFKPVGESRRHPRRALPVAAIAIGAVLILCLAGLWFVLGARSLAVNVTPAEARVELEGGLAIALADHYLLRPGQYRLRVSAPGHVDHQQTIDIADDLRLDIALDRQPGQLAITTDPPGARAALGNQHRGTTPLTLAELPAGRYPLRLTLPRAKPWQGEVEIQGMAITDQLAIALQPAWGLVALTSVPAGAEVSVGGNPVGTTPVTVQVLESGEPVAVKLAGHKRWERVLRGKVGETLTHEPIVLAPADGLATVTSTPAGATVTVNGDYRGRTPLELELPPGKAQRIALFLDGYHTEERSLTLASGEEQQ